MDMDSLGAFNFADKETTVVGLGIEGVDLVRYLATRGSYVTVSDAKPAERLADRIEEVADLPVHLSLGSNQPEDLFGADAVFVSQGVPLDLPGLREARERGIPMHSMLSVFMELCPGPIVGITGSSGKTTTTALVGEMMEADERPVFVGGNIGVGLLDHLRAVRAYTWSVLEMSHTQLQLVQRSPHVAAILNVTPNHLDRFSWDEYRNLKGKVIGSQGIEDTAVLGYDDPEARAMARAAKGRVMWFTSGAKIPGDGVFVSNGWAMLRRDRLKEKLFDLGSLRLRGSHNASNALAAAAIASACGVSADAIACAAESFRGLPHRLELVGEADRIRYCNDSIATTPERTLAGMRSFDEPLVLLLGGRAKRLPLDELVREASKRCRTVVLFGEAASELDRAFRSGGKKVRVVRRSDLADAMWTGYEAAQPGDVVLLSPACTSLDAYDNFERRGDHFRSLVAEIVKEAQPSLS
jgi:UDP-N-acetylmuramoylalanine--D-glutamate ligase